MIDRLLHIANSCPPTNRRYRERFYLMKQRILHVFGKDDGLDLQHIPGKKCWNCGGTVAFDDPYDCWKCDGSGWYKSPVWILLRRWKLGEYTFHEPIRRLYHKPDTSSHDRPVINDYIKHPSYPLKDVNRARFILSLLFDWRLLWEESERLTIRKAISRKCSVCNRRLWTTKHGSVQHARKSRSF